MQDWVDGFALPGAAEKAYKTMRQVIRWAIRRLGVRMYDPAAAGVELPRKAAHRPRTMDAGQVRDYIRALWGHECEGFRPKNQLRQRCHVANADSDKSSGLCIQSGGAMYIANFGGTGLSGTYDFSCTACWPAA